jgi:hypothetical protein
MSMFARAALLILLTLGLARLTAAEPEELAALRAKAEKGSALAQYNLGLAYAEGRLAPVDLPEAFVWLSLASESGATGKALDGVLGSITDAQLAEGRRRLTAIRTALAKTAAANPGRGPRLTPRGFSLTATPATAPATGDAETPDAIAKVPEADVPSATTPDDGATVSDLAQSRKELEKARADLLATNTEFSALRASIIRMEAALAAAKASEARLTAELNAVRRSLEAARPLAAPTPIERSRVENSPPPRP